MEEVIARGVQLLIALAGAYLLALWFVLVVWTYRDIEQRSKNVLTQIFSTLLVVLFYVPGVLLYMILRPKETLDQAFQRSLEEEYLLQDLEELPVCHSCHRYVEDDYILCPHCQTTLRKPCVQCERLVSIHWTTCPYCGSEQSEKVAIEKETVALPAARWRAPSAPRRRPQTTVVQRPHAPAVPTELEPSERPAAVAAQSEPLVEQPKPEPAATSEPESVPEPVPVRLFDRKKTRANNQRSNGTGRSTSVSSNGHGPSMNGNGKHSEPEATPEDPMEAIDKIPIRTLSDPD
jgi:RNA polymerase subunit RPABC4/transcription elongation factor Spt4